MVPAGSTEQFAYSDETVTAADGTVTVSAGEGLRDTEAILLPAGENAETGYTAAHLTPGMPAEFDVTKGEQYRIGVSAQNGGGQAAQ